VSDNIYYVPGCLLSWGDTGELYPWVTIDALPGNVLLEIFDLYLGGYDQDIRLRALRLHDSLDHEDAWHTLVHVCSTWRRLVFASPCRLNLRLLCTNTRPVRKMLHIWPELPIIISAYVTNPRRPGTTNIIHALKQHNRVYSISISCSPNSLLKKIAAMKKPFPALTELQLSSDDKNPPVLPGSFLGGSVPCMRGLSLYHIPFPTLGKLLSSARDLVSLSLSDIPRSGYISPDAIVTCISTLTGLKHLDLNFSFPLAPAERANLYRPPPARVVLPALTRLHFTGTSEYLEDTVSRIDTPLLHDVSIVFFNQLVFDTPHLRHFMGRTEQFSEAHGVNVFFSRGQVSIKPHWRRYVRNRDSRLFVGISCKPLDWQLSSLMQVYNSVLYPLLGPLERLRICDNSSQFQDDIPDNVEWREFLHLFPTIVDLELSRKFGPLVLPALGDLTGKRATEVLYVLQNIFVEELPSSGPVREAIDQFVASRQSYTWPVTVCQRVLPWWRR